MTEPVLLRAFEYWHNVDKDLGDKIEQGVRAKQDARLTMGHFANVGPVTSARPDQGGEGQQVAGSDVHAVRRRRCRAVRAPFPGPR